VFLGRVRFVTLFPAPALLLVLVPQLAFNPSWMPAIALYFLIMVAGLDMSPWRIAYCNSRYFFLVVASVLIIIWIITMLLMAIRKKKKTLLL